MYRKLNDEVDKLSNSSITESSHQDIIQTLRSPTDKDITKILRSPTDKEIKNHLFHLHIDYSWDFASKGHTSSDIFIVYNRYLFSYEEYGDDYYQKAMEELTKIVNMSMLKKRAYLKKLTILTVGWLMSLISILDFVSYNDIDIYDITLDGNMINVSQGLINKKRPLTSLSGNILMVKNKTPNIERVKRCSSERRNSRKINECLEYNVNLNPNYPYLKKENNRYCLEVDYKNAISLSRVFDISSKYIRNRLNPEIKESYQNYTPILFDYPGRGQLKNVDNCSESYLIK